MCIRDRLTDADLTDGSIGILTLMVKAGLAASNGEARRLVVQGGVLVDGEKVEMYLKPGDHVLLAKYAGTEVKVDGETYTILRQGDVLAIVD